MALGEGEFDTGYDTGYDPGYDPGYDIGTCFDYGIAPTPDPFEVDQQPQDVYAGWHWDPKTQMWFTDEEWNEKSPPTDCATEGANEDTCPQYNILSDPVTRAAITGISGLLSSYFASKDAAKRNEIRQQIDQVVGKTMDPVTQARFLAALDRYDQWIASMPDPGMGPEAQRYWNTVSQYIDQTGYLPDQIEARKLLGEAVGAYRAGWGPWENIGRVASELESPEYQRQAAEYALRLAGFGYNRGPTQRAIGEQIAERNAALKQAAMAGYGQQANLSNAIAAGIGGLAPGYGQTFNASLPLQYKMLPEQMKKEDIARQASLFEKAFQGASLPFPYTGTTATDTDTHIAKGADTNPWTFSLANMLGNLSKTMGTKQATETGAEAANTNYSGILNFLKNLA